MKLKPVRASKWKTALPVAACSAVIAFLSPVTADSPDDLTELQKRDVLTDAQIDNYPVQGRWIGPAWWANRLQDWQANGSMATEILCSPNRAFLGWRTAHDVTRDIDLSQGNLDVSVVLQMIPKGDDKVKLAPNSMSGLLIGAGHSLSDPLARAMVFDMRPGKGQKIPAVPGTGIAVGLSGDGFLNIVDLDHGKVLKRKAITMVEGRVPKSRLRVVTRLVGDKVAIDAMMDKSDGVIKITATVGKERLKGGLALLSHAGSKMKGKYATLETVFSEYKPVSGVRRHNGRALGPVAAAQYSIDRGVLKLSAQCMPQIKGTKATLSFLRDGKWQDAVSATVHHSDQMALFRVEKWDSGKAVPYRISIPLAGSDRPATYTGMIAAEPRGGKLRLAALGCVIHRPWGVVKNWNQVLYFPHHDLQKRVAEKKPDVVFFYGDQMYEGTPSYVDRSNYFEDYLYKWLFHCIAFKDVIRNVPSVTIPDDHDVYQGNHWGQGARKAPGGDWNKGGYTHPGEFVAMVHRTQTSHLPDAYEPDCLEQNIPAYHCDWNWGGVSFAILGDRYFKSGPAGQGLPKSGTNRPDHYNNPAFDTKDLDLPGLQLLGKPQEKFLSFWAADWSHGAKLKAVLSQSPFGNLATHHSGAYLIADLDGNGWPQSGRKRALSIMRAARAPHIAGDQHLSTMVQHGIEKHGDAVFSFTAPAVANAYARAYHPSYKGNYYKTTPPKPSEYLGNRLDGFKNKVTFLAVANPDTRPEGPYTTKKLARMNQQVPGFGIVDFDTQAQTVTFHSLPRSEEVASKLKGGEYPGWPVTIKASQNDGRTPIGELARVQVKGRNPVVRVWGPDGILQWAHRMVSDSFTVHAYAQGKHKVEIGSGDESGKWHTFEAEPAAQGRMMKIAFP